MSPGTSLTMLRPAFALTYAPAEPGSAGANDLGPGHGAVLMCPRWYRSEARNLASLGPEWATSPECDEFAQALLKRHLLLELPATLSIRLEGKPTHSLVVLGFRGGVQAGRFVVELYGPELRRDGLPGSKYSVVALPCDRPVGLAIRDGSGRWKAITARSESDLPDPQLQQARQGLMSWVQQHCPVTSA